MSAKCSSNRSNQSVLDHLTEIDSHVLRHREIHGPAVQLFIPWLSLKCRLGVSPTVDELLKNEPRSCPNRHGCVVDAEGIIYERQGDELVQCERQKAGRVGRVYCGFPREDDDDFMLWCLNEVYAAFIGGKPREWKIEPLDLDHENTRVDNLLIRVDPAASNGVNQAMRPAVVGVPV